MRQAISAVVVGILLAQPVAALECIDVPLEILMKREEIVLLGRIDAVRLSTVSAHFTVTITVKELWKGTTPSVIELQQPVIAGGIEFWTETGKDNVLFVRTITPEQPLYINAYSLRSGFVAAECISKPAAQFDLKALGPSGAPEP
jgi:hypothetical protein